MQSETLRQYGKVPAVTLGFWIVKILATTLGETGGDTLSMTMNLGYLAATGIFAVLLRVGGSAWLISRRSLSRDRGEMATGVEPCHTYHTRGTGGQVQ